MKAYVARFTGGYRQLNGNYPDENAAKQAVENELNELKVTAYNRFRWDDDGKIRLVGDKTERNVWGYIEQ